MHKAKTKSISKSQSVLMMVTGAGPMPERNSTNSTNSSPPPNNTWAQNLTQWADHYFHVVDKVQWGNPREIFVLSGKVYFHRPEEL